MVARKAASKAASKAVVTVFDSAVSTVEQMVAMLASSKVDMSVAW